MKPEQFFLLYHYLFCFVLCQASGKSMLYFLSLLPHPDPRPAFTPLIELGPLVVPAAYLAVDQINNRSDLLQDYDIGLIDADSGCFHTTEAAIEFTANLFHSNKQIVGIIGPACSRAVLTISSLLNHEEIGLINVHFGSAPQVADRTRFPYTFGTADTSHVVAEAFYALAKRNEWTRVAILYQSDSLSFTAAAVAIEKSFRELPDYEVAVFSPVSVTYFPVKALRDSLVRVFFTMVSPELTRKLLCIAHNENLLYPAYQWLTTEVFLSGFDRTEFYYDGKKYSCSEEDMMVAVRGAINLECRRTPAVLNVTTLSGLKYQEYEEQYKQRVAEYNNVSVEDAVTTTYANLFYDGVWAMALALNNSIGALRAVNTSLEDYRYGHREITDVVAGQLYELDFIGASGRVRFEPESGYVNRTVEIQEVINGMPTVVGWYLSGNLEVNGSNAQFVDSNFGSRNVHVEIPLAVISLLITIVVLVITILAQIVNVAFRNFKTIKASSPRLSHLAYVGCYLIIFGLIIYTLLVTFPHDLTSEEYASFCNIIPWCLSAGFTLMFGTAFVKAWRLYRIFIGSVKQAQRPGKMFSDYSLGGIVLALLVVDIFVCSLWRAIDPLKQKVETDKEYDGDDVIIVDEKRCHSHQIYIWFSILLGYKAALMIASVYIAVLTRNISLKDFKTQNIAILIYLLTLVSAAGMPVYLILQIPELEVNVNIRYLILWITLETLVCLCLALLLFPPILPLLKACKTGSVAFMSTTFGQTEKTVHCEDTITRKTVHFEDTMMRNSVVGTVTS